MPREKVVLINLETKQSFLLFNSLLQNMSSPKCFLDTHLLVPLLKFLLCPYCKPWSWKDLWGIPHETERKSSSHIPSVQGENCISLKFCVFQWDHWPVFSSYPLCNRWAANWWSSFPQEESIFKYYFCFDRLLSDWLYLIVILSVFLILSLCYTIVIFKRQSDFSNFLRQVLKASLKVQIFY